MKLKRESKQNLELNLCNKAIIYILVILALPFIAIANPSIAGEPIPPGSAIYIEDKSILDDIGLSGPGAWCYDHRANSILITAVARAKARYEIRLQYEMEKQKTKYEFKIDKLEIRTETLREQHKEILLIKDKEINRLTEAVLKRPNDYTAWWATGGFVTGVVATISVVLLL